MTSHVSIPNEALEKEFWSPAYANIFGRPQSAETVAQCGRILQYFCQLDPNLVADPQIELLVHLGLAQQVERTDEPGELELLIKRAREAELQGEPSTDWVSKIAAHLDEHPEAVNEVWPGFSVTPLHESACSSLQGITSLLLRRGADRTLRNSFDETAAERCRAMGLEDMAKLIEEWPQ